MNKIVFIDHSVAFRIDDKIYINEALLKPEYEKIYKQVLEHEMEHTDSFQMKDFLMDLTPKFKNMKLMTKFMFKHPRSFYQYKLIWRVGNVYYFDWTNIFLLLIFLLLLIGMPYFAKWLYHFLGGLIR